MGREIHRCHSRSQSYRVTRQPDAEFWRGRRVLVSGHTGFKGAWLTYWLHKLGARVHGVSLPPHTQPNLFELAGLEDLLDGHHICDIREPSALADIVKGASPEVVLHLAAQSLVRPGYQEPLATIATNVQGTANLLDALRSVDTVRAAVVVTIATTRRTTRFASRMRWAATIPTAPAKRPRRLSVPAIGTLICKSAVWPWHPLVPET